MVPPVSVPPSHELDFIDDPDLPPELQKKPPKGLPIRLTEEGTEADNAGILEASRELTKRFLAATKHAGLAVDMFRRGCEARPVGILFSGGIDSVAVLAACVAWKIPCVAAVAGFTGATAPPEDIAAARAACAFFGVELLVREVGSVAEVAAALARLSPATATDVDKARLSLCVYFASSLCARGTAGASFLGRRRAPRRRRRRGVTRPADEEQLGAPLCARCSTPSCRGTTPPRILGLMKYTTRSSARSSRSLRWSCPGA